MAAAAAAARRGDHSSFANVGEAAVRHGHYELDVDFGSRVVDGYAHLRVEAVAGAPRRLVLDTRDLAVHAVELLAPEGPRPLEHHLGEPHKALGTPLRIELPAGLEAGSAVDVGVRFSCSPGSSALQFLAPEQTAGGRHPYLFSQCQAIHARSLVPCQDTPSVKSSYSAAVRVPEPLTALMSAVPCEGPPRLDGGDAAAGNRGAGGAPAAAFAAPEGVPHLPPRADGSPGRVFYFSQKVPIPSYLIALAVGELESRELSDRSRVWSEPSMVDAGAFEFAETGKFLDTAEELAGPYVWGRYDLLLLPWSFPYGGMENPCLTFATPTLLAGDRSLTNVVAHEIAHSWTGNLVTNASWENFWLNEGWTVFLERKIIGRLQGEASLQLAAAQGAASLAEEVARLGPGHNFTRLVPDLSGGEDPDDAFSRVPYEKGFYFLYYLQGLVGGPAAFEPFMRQYFQAFSFQTVTSDQFREFFTEHFRDNAAVSSIDWDSWLHAPGMPPVTNTYDASLAAAAHELAARWHTADVMGLGVEQPPAGAGPDDMEGWSTAQVVAFLERLAELRSLTPLAAPTCRLLARLYRLDDSKNSEVRAAWYRLCIPAGDEAALPGVVDMLTSQGRMKFLRPLYRALAKTPKGRELALSTFREAAPRYHPIASKMVAADLGLRSE